VGRVVFVWAGLFQKKREKANKLHVSPLALIFIFGVCKQVFGNFENQICVFRVWWVETKICVFILFPLVWIFRFLSCFGDLCFN